jgi:putative protease
MQGIHKAIELGAREFVLNAPWQRGLFSATSRQARLMAGPYCNLANPLAIDELSDAGFIGAILGPELSGEDYLALPETCTLPLGIVLTALWPLCISRISGEGVAPDTPFLSPKGETAWMVRKGGSHYLFPNWRYDLSAKRSLLEEAGYRLFVHMEEAVPKGMAMKKRKGEWNWKHGFV